MAGDQARKTIETEDIPVEHPIEPVDIATVSAGIPTDLDPPHVDEAADEQTNVSAVTKTGFGDRIVDSGASTADAPDVRAGRSADSVGVAAGVVILDDPASLPATSCIRVVGNHASPSLLPDS